MGGAGAESPCSRALRAGMRGDADSPVSVTRDACFPVSGYGFFALRKLRLLLCF